MKLTNYSIRHEHISKHQPKLLPYSHDDNDGEAQKITFMVLNKSPRYKYRI